MEHVEGRIFWDATFPDVDREERPAYFYAMSESLARLHAIDPEAVGLGDFRCDNMFFDPVRPEIRAVLDWEFSTLGHPLADFAYSAMMYRMPPDIVAGLAGADLAALNIPSEDQYIARYCAAAGRSDIADYEFYIAFNLFRLAAIFHGIKGRVIRGTAASSEAPRRAASFPLLARMARGAARSVGG